MGSARRAHAARTNHISLVYLRWTPGTHMRTLACARAHEHAYAFLHTDPRSSGRWASGDLPSDYYEASARKNLYTYAYAQHALL